MVVISDLDMWMQRPAVLNCPPGLEHLTQVDQLFIKQKVDVIETFVPFEVKNRYTCLDKSGQVVYKCYEGESSYIFVSDVVQYVVYRSFGYVYWKHSVID
ncbi:Phospholipid scramblase 2 [Schistosoma japonicum]|nr:Phospholipid scramblase 2 [Schistosoma japonicum]